MDIYTLEDLSLREIKALLVGIKGIDAMFIGTLQIKIQGQIEQIEQIEFESNKNQESPTPPSLPTD